MVGVVSVVHCLVVKSEQTDIILDEIMNFFDLLRAGASKTGLAKVAAKIREHNFHALLIIGGYEVSYRVLHILLIMCDFHSVQAYTSVLQMYEARNKHPEFQIPLICIPATISNNVPGTEFSIGADTALNEIVKVRIENDKKTNQTG